MSSPSKPTRKKARDAESEAPKQSNIDLRRSRARARPSASYLDRRQELVAAAARVMSRKGIHEMTLNDIALEAGSDRASIYYYVAGKEELLAEVLRDSSRENLAAFTAIAESDLPPAQKVRRIIEALMASFDAHFPYLYVWVQEDPSRLQEMGSDALDEITAASEKNYRLIRGVLEEGVRSGALHSTLPVGILAQTVLGLAAWTYRWYEPGHDLSAQQVAQGLADLLLTGISGPTEHEAPA